MGRHAADRDALVGDDEHGHTALETDIVNAEFGALVSDCGRFAVDRHHDACGGRNSGHHDRRCGFVGPSERRGWR